MRRWQEGLSLFGSRSRLAGEGVFNGDTCLKGLFAGKPQAGASSYTVLRSYRVNVKRLINAPGNNADAVARWS